MSRQNNNIPADGNKSANKSVKTIAVMMGATVIAKLLGMLRSVLMAGAYGTTPAANAFTAASKLPLTFFDLLLAASVLGCFIPAYNSFCGSERDSKKADDFAAVFLTFIIVACGILAVLGIVFARPLLTLIAPNLDETAFELAVVLTRIMFPLVIFTGSAYTLVGVLQSKGSFIAPAMISAISNAGVVLYLAVIDPALGDKGIYGLALAYTLSWLIQLLTLALPLKRCGYSLRFGFNFKDPELLRALKTAPPIMIGSWLAPAGTLLGQFFAARVGIPGATTNFDYANNIYIIIAGTLTYSICNYTFPKISKLSALGDEEKFAAMVRSGLKLALFIIVPIMSAAFVLSGEGVSILYLRGKFTAEDAANTSAALIPILAAMPFFGVTELFSRVFYSKNEVKIPMLAAVFGIIGNAVVGGILVSLNIFGISAVGIANAAGQIISALVLLIAAYRRIPGLLDKVFFKDILKLILGGAIVFVVCALMKGIIKSDPFNSSFIVNTLKAVCIFLPSVAIYLVYSKIVGLGLFESGEQKNL